MIVMKLDVLMSYDHYGKAFFKCLVCGLCCFWGANIGVFLTAHDLKRFYRSKLFPRVADVRSLTIRGVLATQTIAPNFYACIFQEHQPGKCRIYELRPFECRLYPLILDATPDGRLMFHLEHCDGVSFRDNGGIDMIRDIHKFLDTYFDKEDFEFLQTISLRKILRSKPLKIKLYREVFGTWLERKEIWNRIISRIMDISDLSLLPKALLARYNEYRLETIGEELENIPLISLFHVKDEYLYHRFLGRLGGIKRKEIPMSQIRKYVMDYILAVIKRERTYGFLKLYDITMDQEVTILYNVLRDIACGLRLYDNINVECFERVLALVDQFMEYYARMIVGKIEVSQIIGG